MKQLCLISVLLLGLGACKPQTENVTSDQNPNASAQQNQTLKVYKQLNAFAFTNQAGETFGSEALNGKVWLADFIFTTCTAECPLMTAEMKKFQDAFKDNNQVKLVSFTVDPETDTPNTLKAYGEKFQTNAEQWSFLTGEREELYRLTTKEFMLPVQDLRPQNNDHTHHHHEAPKTETIASEKTAQNAPVSNPFLHSQKFVLVDQQMQIRGFYDSTNPDEMTRLMKQDIPHLLKQ